MHLLQIILTKKWHNNKLTTATKIFHKKGINTIKKTCRILLAQLMSFFYCFLKVLFFLTSNQTCSFSKHCFMFILWCYYLFMIFLLDFWIVKIVSQFGKMFISFLVFFFYKNKIVLWTFLSMVKKNWKFLVWLAKER